MRNKRLAFHCFKSALVVFGHVIVRRIFKIKHDIVGFVLSDIADFEQKFGKEFACFVGRFWLSLAAFSKSLPTNL